MMSYTTLGTNQCDKALAFYDVLFAIVAGSRLMDMDGFVLYGTSPAAGSLALARPFDGNAATSVNGTIIAIQVGSKELVQQVYGKGLELSGQDEGAPRPRTDDFYGRVIQGPRRQQALLLYHGIVPLLY
jgi:hypothetical protein